jgi:hypothetical protein
MLKLSQHVREWARPCGTAASAEVMSELRAMSDRAAAAAGGTPTEMARRKRAAAKAAMVGRRTLTPASPRVDSRLTAG